MIFVSNVPSIITGMRPRQLLSELFTHVNVYVVYWVVYSHVYVYSVPSWEGVPGVWY